ncbi:BMP family ABC transporter substrate-binding protein [Spiroplasma melliferum]|uniref:ABC transporter substrate-binding protein n=2 Tax=Spiroplasma melliferum TaxID=2134 RepID=A0AAI9T3C8_SPIME|nr:BMP family ABC transporter substrate-binding protein [Spiroplasma melliferum]ELL44210.1 xylose ABC transporter periplasmic binding component [Spiroplasma melliferum IPMB4A]KAI92340.1 ABC transporter substrate-binding protein [Spiroplasma melliferum KC3]QCO23774.1 ABC-type transport system substrate-binding protein [Spiroplasma melliferum]
MKRILQSLMMISIIGTSVSSVFACIKKYNFDNSIWVITDGGTINDLAFNQAAWEGASKYVFTQKNQTTPPQDWKNSNWRASYFESVSQTPGDYKNAYITSSIAGAKTLVLPGFNHGNTLGWAAGLVDNIIYIDGSSQNIHLNMDQKAPLAKNIIGITYQAEASGFYASLATSIYLNAHQNEYNGQLKVGSYGGMDNPVAVSNYMWGFLVGIDLFNTIINSSINSKWNNLKHNILKQVQNINPKITTLQSIVKVQNVLKQNESWFSQSFQAGDGKIISDELLARGARIIFPVAGAQVQDTINQIKVNKANAKIVGVDTEQSKIYGEDYVVTSALKQIATSTFDALKNIYSSECGYDAQNNIWDNTKQTNNCWINTDQTSLDHPSWTGIETTKWVTQDLVDFLHNTTDNHSKDTLFDKMVKILQYAYKSGIDNYPPISAQNFTNTLQNTYETQTKLKAYLLAAIEKVL